MQTKNMYNEEDYELDNVYNEEDRNGVKGDSSIWYN